MEYTPAEQEVLSLFNRTDFKNISKNELIGYASKLSELRPEVAKEVIKQFPELAKFILSAASEYKGMLEDIISSDDDSLKQVYGLLNKEAEADVDSRKEFSQMAGRILDDLSKGLAEPNLSEEERKSIREQELEVLRMIDKKDSEVRQHGDKIAEMAGSKDTEKRSFNWKTLGAASMIVLTVIGVGAAALGGNFDLKLPKKS